MAGLTPSVLAENARQGPFKGTSRLKIIDIKIKKGLPFIIAKNNADIIGVKKQGTNLIYEDKKTTKSIPFSKLQKDVDFGGIPSKKVTSSVSGKVVEVLSEAFFCIYCALRLEGTLKKYNDDEAYKDWVGNWTGNDLTAFANKYKIANYVNMQLKATVFKSYVKFADAFLVDKQWHKRLMAQIDKMFGKYPLPSKSFIMIRADNMPKSMDPYNTFSVVANLIKRKYGFSRSIDKDKWNPADVWFYTPTAAKILSTELKRIDTKVKKNPAISITQLNELNALIYKLFKKNELYPISLKAPSGTSANITAVNEDSDIEQVLKFSKVDLSQGNLDVKLRFDIIFQKKKSKKKIRKMTGYLKSKTDTGGFRLELEFPGYGARFGTLGTENYQFIIYNTDKTGINSLQRIRKQSNSFKSMPDKYKPGASQFNWLGASGYQKLRKQTETGTEKYLEGYLQTLFQKVNNTNFNIKPPADKTILNKTIASEIAVAINEITNKVKKEITLENIYNFTVSQGAQIGVSSAQLKSRGEKVIVSKEIADTLFNSCFHLKVY